MSEPEVNPDANPYDDNSFVATSILGGRRGVIVGAEIIKHNYGGTITNLVSALALQISVPEFEKLSTPRFSTGGALPSQDGRTAAERGPHLVGKITKGSNIADFLSNLKATGFPLSNLVGPGFVALEGADITWKTVEKKIAKGKIQAYDFPGEFHGFVTPERLAELKAAAASVAVEGEAAAEVPATAPPADDDLKAAVSAAILTALRAESSGEIARGHLSQKVGPALKDHPNRTRALALLISDTFLATIPGVTYDKKSLKLS